MKRLYTIPFLTLALLVGCNEKISPTLQESSIGGPDIINVPTPSTEFTFKIVDKTSRAFYHLHKTGQSNLNTKCEVTSLGAAPTHKEFKVNPTRDITCYLEAEELELGFNGIDIGVEATPGTCEYVAYTPYSYYGQMPGNSSSNYTKFSCGEGVPGGTTYSGLNCNEAILTTPIAPPATANAFILPPGQEKNTLCQFDYSASGGPNCDPGIITINNVNATMGEDAFGNPIVVTTTAAPTTISCGGTVSACLAGPGSQHSLYSPRTPITEVSPKTGYSKTWSYDGFYPSDKSVSLANFRRELANSSINYIDSTAPGYISTFFNQFIYDGRVMDRYALNLEQSGPATNLDPTTFNNLWGGKFYGKPAAAEPNLGIGPDKTSSFYQFECQTRAKEPTARIRLVVRDWDQYFPGPSYGAFQNMEYISDIYLGTDPDYAYMDLETTEEGDDYEYNPFNDFKDWDDLIPLSNNGTKYSPVNGWWLKSNFPGM